MRKRLGDGSASYAGSSFFGLRVWIHHQRKRIHYERVAYGVRFAANFLFSVLLAIAMTRTATDAS